MTPYQVQLQKSIAELEQHKEAVQKNHNRFMLAHNNWMIAHNEKIAATKARLANELNTASRYAENSLCERLGREFCISGSPHFAKLCQLAREHSDSSLESIENWFRHFVVVLMP